MASNCIRGGLDCILGKISLLKEWSAIEQAAQGSVGVTILGGVQKMCRYDISGYGLVGMVVLS